MPNAVELLIENPPPRTPNLPATAGSASTAAAALPPLRFRSSPHPHRTSAGELSMYSRPGVAGPRASIPASAAARSMVHACGRLAQLLGAAACVRRGTHVGVPASNSTRWTASATGRSVPGRAGRCRSACRARRGARGSMTTSVRRALRLPQVRNQDGFRMRRD